jgi:Tfp pilus assembly protein PilN
VIRTNLSTRPFYNERIVRLVLLGAGLVVLAATLFNVARILQLSRQDTQLATQAASDEVRARDLLASAARRRATVDPRTLELASVDARQANDLIDRRTFSWTELVNVFEQTLPDDARITAVRPKIDPKLGTVVTITVMTRSVDDVNQFIDRLEASGSFTQLVRMSEQIDENQQQWQAIVEGIYKSDTARPAGEGPAPAEGAAR